MQICQPESTEFQERQLKGRLFAISICIDVYRQLSGFRIRICYEPELETTGAQDDLRFLLVFFLFFSMLENDSTFWSKHWGSGIRAQPQWTEILGVRASATASDKPGVEIVDVLHG